MISEFNALLPTVGFKCLSILSGNFSLILHFFSICHPFGRNSSRFNFFSIPIQFYVFLESDYHLYTTIFRCDFNSADLSSVWKKVYVIQVLSLSAIDSIWIQISMVLVSVMKFIFISLCWVLPIVPSVSNLTSAIDSIWIQFDSSCICNEAHI